MKSCIAKTKELSPNVEMGLSSFVFVEKKEQFLFLRPNPDGTFINQQEKENFKRGCLNGRYFCLNGKTDSFPSIQILHFLF